MNGRRDIPPLSLDRANEQVTRGTEPLRLTPKAFAVLRYLMERPGRLATKDELLTALWPGAVVTEGCLSTCVREIRRALDDDPALPAYIETVHRRGYRYIGGTLDRSCLPALRTPAQPPALLVGRERELAVIERAVRDVQRGQRRVLFLSGEAGIGKTALVERVITAAGRQTNVQIARGQCIEQYGAGEPYLPWFDALNHLCVTAGGAHLAAVLRRYAPMWLAQLPWLIGTGERKQLQREIAGTTRERMMRELAHAFEALAASRPIVVILEDLHWSDPSSIALLSYLARRPPCPLLLLGTYRPQELHVAPHPLVELKQELSLHGTSAELQLDFLTRAAVAEYVQSRFPGVPDALAGGLYRRTDGNPLFMVNVVDYLLARGGLVHESARWQLTEGAQACMNDVPENLKEMIERQLERLSHAERRVLEAASVAGATFSAASVAAALADSVEHVEERLSLLARRSSFVRATEYHTWPDETQSNGYEFIHALYQHVLYERIGVALRSRMHVQIGDRLETAWQGDSEEIAAVLALHFKRGRDWKRAVRSLAQAGESAMRRSAYVEAIALLNEGIGLLTRLPLSGERDSYELQLQVALGVCYANTRGYAAPEVGATFERAHTLWQQNCATAPRFRALRGLWFFAEQRAHLQKARSVAEELLEVAARQCDPAVLVEGHRIMATTAFHLGDFAGALEHAQRGLALHEVNHSADAFLYGQDPGVCCLAWNAWAHWYLGLADKAVGSAVRGVELARELRHPFTLSYALNFTARLFLCRREPERAESYAREGLQVAREHGLTSMVAMGQIMYGLSRTYGEQTGIEDLEEGVSRWRATGARLMTPYWMSLLATGLYNCGRTAKATEALDDALREAERTDERWFSCEMYMLRATLAGNSIRGPTRCEARTQAHLDLRQALRVATELRSPSLQLRAARALSPLLRDEGKAGEARELLGATYATFREGFGTLDLVEARAELARLGA